MEIIKGEAQPLAETERRWQPREHHRRGMPRKQLPTNMKAQSLKRQENEACINEMKECAEQIWKAISRYVAYGQDANSKDPDQPCLCDKKKQRQVP